MPIKFVFNIIAFICLFLAACGGFCIWWLSQMIDMLQVAKSFQWTGNVPYPVWHEAQLGQLYDKGFMGRIAYNLAQAQGIDGAMQSVSLLRSGFIIGMLLLLLLLLFLFVRRSMRTVK